MPRSLNSQKSLKLIIISALIIFGFLFKLYKGPFHTWFNSYGAGVLYEIFWILFISLFLTIRKDILRLPVYVFIVTSLLEVMQLWHPFILENFRQTFLGKALIGTTFSFLDFPHYALGCFIGWVLINNLLEDNKL